MTYQFSTTDIRTVWDVQNARGDWQMSGHELLGGSDLETAILISLFSDRLANPDDVIPDGTDDRRGWWGDQDGDLTGSRLWLLDRAKLEPNTAALAKTYAQEALQWLIDDGVAVRVDVAAQVASTVPGRLIIGVVVFRTDGPKVALNFVWVWNQPNAI